MSFLAERLRIIAACRPLPFVGDDDTLRRAAKHIDMLEKRLELTQHAYDRLALCPDHRDKATGLCIVCQAERRTRQEIRLSQEDQ